MWNVRKEVIEHGNVVKYHCLQGEEELSFEQFMLLLTSSNDFRSFWIELLKNAPFEAYFWETKSVTKARLSEHFEFVIVKGAILKNLTANSAQFEQYFEQNKSAVTFPNLGKDAQLVVPVKLDQADFYTHLGTFMRNAPIEQLNDFWKLAGEAYQDALNDNPTWLSTAGLGVHWLHLRVDTRPKYYRYTPYK